MRKLFGLFVFFVVLFRVFGQDDEVIADYSHSEPTSSGYLPVRPGAELFYVYYEAAEQAPGPDTPLFLWLQGGPGCSSMLGALFELGPYRLNRDLSLVDNPGSWGNEFGLLFIDSPVGTGFSWAADDSLLCENQSCITEDVYTALRKWFAAQPAFFSQRPFFLSGESYAGKHVPALAHFIMFNQSSVPFNLAGVVIGNGYTDPTSQFAVMAEPCYSMGIIGSLEKAKVLAMIQEGLELTKKGEWAKAKEIRLQVISFLESSGGLGTLYDLRRYDDYQTAPVAKYLNQPQVKAALGAYANITFEECSDKVAQALSADNMKSMKWAVDDLLGEKTLPILLFQGQNDGRDGVISTAAWLSTLTWPDLPLFLNASSTVWTSTIPEEKGPVNAGTRRSFSPLTQCIVRNCGHMCAHDQSTFTRDMITQWIGVWLQDS